jgi:membrane-associated protein
MNIISFLIDFVLHLDRYLGLIIQSFGLWTYAILFFVIFIETGLVITPFLPGDSLIFAAGAFCALGILDVKLLFVLMALAAIAGDTANYWIGRKVGPAVFTTRSRWFKKEYLDRTRAFFDKHGGISIFLARFIPIIRTFVPFVAGIGQMRYGYFITYNVLGGVIWTALFSFGGYFFGNLAIVKDHFSLVIIAIVLISVLPAIIEIAKSRRAPAEPVGPQ